MKRRSLAFAAAAFVFGFVALAGDARAEPKKQNGVITLDVIQIVGRVQKPIASVDVSKIQPKLTLSELKLVFLDRIEEATNHDPF